MELEQDSELQFHPKGVGRSTLLAKDAQVECDRERAAFQIEKECLLHDLNQAQADEVEAEKKAADSK